MSPPSLSSSHGEKADLNTALLTVRQAIKGKKGECQDFQVRPEKIRAALLWLNANNEYYANIDIVDANSND